MTTIRGMTCLVLGLSCVFAGCIPSDAAIEGEIAAERRAAYLDWKRMRDRGESTAANVSGPLALDDAIKLALQYNKSLQNTLQERDVARGGRIAAWNVALPSVTISGGATLSENRADTGNITNYSSGVTVSQPIMQGEAIPARLRTARLTTALTDENIRSAVQTLIASVANSYYDVLLAQLLLESNKEAVTSAEAQLRVVTEKRKQETATDYDVLRAQVDVATYRAQMLGQQNQIDTSRVALLKYMGVSQDSDITFSDRLEFLPMRPVFERAVEIAAGRRPDLRAAGLSARMADEAVKIARSAYWPALSGSFSQSFSDVSGQNRRAAFSRNDWSAELGARWTFGIDTYGNVETSKARARQSRIDMLDREEAMLSEIRTFMNSLSNAEEVVKALVVNQDAAREALRLVEIGHQAGVKTELDVQDARKALTDVQAKYATSLADHTKARLNLQIAMGVLGPQRVSDGPISRPGVPIANIEEFAATDVKPIRAPEMGGTNINGMAPPRPVAAPGQVQQSTPPRTQAPARATPRSAVQGPARTPGSAPAPTSDEWPVMQDFLGSAQPVSASADDIMLASIPEARVAPVEVAPPMPPAAAVVAVNEAPAPVVAAAPAEPAPAPLFKVTIK